MIEELLQHWYLLLMLAVGIALMAIGLYWQRQEKRTRIEQRDTEPFALHPVDRNATTTRPARHSQRPR